MDRAAPERAWSPSRRGLAKDHLLSRRLHVIAYRATLDVPRELVQFVAALLAEERRRRGIPRASRALSATGHAASGCCAAA